MNEKLFDMSGQWATSHLAEALRGAQGLCGSTELSTRVMRMRARASKGPKNAVLFNIARSFAGRASLQKIGDSPFRTRKLVSEPH